MHREHWLPCCHKLWFNEVRIYRHWSCNISRADRINTNIFVNPFNCKTLGHVDNACFGCIICCLALRNIYNVSGHEVIFNHNTSGFAAYNIFTGKVNVQTFSPFFNSCLKSIFMVADTRIIDNNIKSSIDFHNLFHAFSYTGFVCGIGNDIKSFSAFRFNQFYCFSGTGTGKDSNISSATSKLAADYLPNTTSTTCYKCNFAFK